MKENLWPETVLSQLENLVRGPTDTQKANELSRLFNQYGDCLRTYFKARGLSASDAEDATQEFLVKKFIEPQSHQTLPAKYVTRMGWEHIKQRQGAQSRPITFRAYLIASAKNFAYEWIRSRPDRVINDPELESLVAKPYQPHQDEVDYAIDVVKKAVAELKSRHGRDLKWYLFVDYALEPAKLRSARPNYDELYQRYRNDKRWPESNSLTPKRVETAISSMRRALRNRIRGSLREDLDQDRLIPADDQLLDLNTILENVYVLSREDEIGSLSSILQWSCEAVETADETLDEAWAQFLHASLFDQLCASPSESLRSVIFLSETPLQSFADLLVHPDPPLEILTAIKDFAKNENQLPIPVAKAIYVAAVAAAQLRKCVWISSYKYANFAARMRKVLAADWLDLTTRELIGECLHTLEASSDNSSAIE